MIILSYAEAIVRRIFAIRELYKGAVTNKRNFQQTFEIEGNFFTGDFAVRVLCCCTAPSEKSVVELTSE